MVAAGRSSQLNYSSLQLEQCHQLALLNNDHAGRGVETALYEFPESDCTED